MESNDQIITSVTLHGSAADTLRKLYNEDVSARVGAFDTTIQQDSVVARFLELDIPQEPVSRKAYFADVVRNQVATIQGTRASNSIRQVEKYWAAVHSGECDLCWASVMDSGLVVKIDDDTHIQLRHATSKHWAIVAARRMKEAESSMQKAEFLKDIAAFFVGIMNTDETMGDLTDERIKLSLQMVAPV